MYNNLLDVKGLKIGVPKEYFGEGINEEVKATLEKTNEEYKKIETYLSRTDSDNPDVWNGYRGVTDSLKITYEVFASYIKELIEK